MKKNILVTGGAGFIGSNIARRCLSLGQNVVIVDNLATGKLENVPEAAQFVNLDISIKDDYKKLPDIDFDAVFHSAAQSSGEISNEKPSLDLTSNALGTLFLLQWSMEKGINRFLYASSMAVYGNVSRVPVSEGEACRPISFYGISKLAGEHYVQHYYGKGLQTTIFRMFSVYGPHQDLENLKQGMVSIYMAYLLKGEPVLVKGSGERFRDFIYVDDVVDAWLMALDNPKSFGNIYNLGSGKKTLVRELIQEEINVFGLDPNYPVRHEGSTPADQFGMYADISKIKRDLSWAPKTTLTKGLKKMVEWARGSSS